MPGDGPIEGKAYEECVEHLRSSSMATRVVHAGTEPEPVTGAIMPPVFLTSTYVQKAPAAHRGYEYSRTGNPTRTALERAIAELESGAYGLCYASGMSAIDAVLRCLSAGDHVIAGNDLYGGTYRLFDKIYRRFGLEFTFLNPQHLDAVTAAIRPNTKLIWVETPSNPLLRIFDLSAISEIAKKSAVTVCVDNTFATPILQKPLSLGADLVIHSTTKYLGGHSDVVGGALVTNSEAHYEACALIQNSVGAIPGPLDCFLTLRGIKTLALRMRQHCENAEKISQFLAQQPEIEKVYYPGLQSHPNHDLATRQMTGFGGMISFVLKGDVETGKRFCTLTRIFQLAESLGGVESLIEHPSSMTHAAIEPEVRREAGLADSLIRLSVGIEDAFELIADLDQALELLPRKC